MQDLYLKLDISNSNFEMVVDSISSGLDSSASSYIQSSSYVNGLLVRPTNSIGGVSSTNSPTPFATSSSLLTTTSTSSGSTSSGSTSSGSTSSGSSY